MLPAISDIAKHVPDAQIDWLAEDAFASIPAWHPAVSHVLQVAHRRWRRAWWSSQVRRERHAFEADLRGRQYDVVLDMQALLKSVWWVRMASGVKHGLDWRSAREPLATLFYDVRHRIEFWQPAVTRQRLLAASAFGYSVQGEPDFGLQRFELQAQAAHRRDAPYAMIMPSASRDDKLWPVPDWHAVFDLLTRHGLQLKLLAGNPAEAERAQALIQGYSNAEVLPRDTLTDTVTYDSLKRCRVG